jgi:phage baseplate assembly protein W
MATVGTPGAIRQPPPQAGNFGQGAAYPLTYTTTGSLRLSYGRQSVEDSLRSILETVPGERAMLPDYGAAVGVFEPIDIQRMIAKFQLDVSAYEPRIDTVDITTDYGPGQGEVTMNISYTLKDEAGEHLLTYNLFIGPSF